MDSSQAQTLFIKHCTAMAYIDVQLPIGDRNIGSAFHIGDGVFVTARHVVENNTILEMKITEPVGICMQEMFPDLPQEIIDRSDKVYQKWLGFIPIYKHWPEPLKIAAGPFFLDDPRIDLAIFKVENIHPAAATIDLGFHYDDWIYRRHWALSEAILLGYPPIPLTDQPHLIAAKAEIHTYVNIRNSPYLHFILSATPRGGFSGGLALHEGGFALGVITTGLVENHNVPELGFFAVLSVEPIHVLLQKTNLTPNRQKENWEKRVR